MSNHDLPVNELSAAQGACLGLAELAEERLRRTGYPALRNVSCSCVGATITVTGSLPTYYLKQVALAAVTGLEDVDHVVDQLVVRGPYLSPLVEASV